MNISKMLKHTRNLLLCGIKIELPIQYLDVKESEVFLKSVSIICMASCVTATLALCSNYRDIYEVMQIDG